MPRAKGIILHDNFKDFRELLFSRVQTVLCLFLALSHKHTHTQANYNSEDILLTCINSLDLNLNCCMPKHNPWSNLNLDPALTFTQGNCVLTLK